MTLEHQQKHISIFVCVGIVVATLVAYEPMRHNGFVNYDDNAYIVYNQEVQSGITWESLGQAFTKPHSFMWHPLTTISHMLDYELFGLNPTGHHLVSLTIHIVNVLLVFGIFRSLGGAIWLSAFIAGVFALHPIQVESVAWAAERKSVMSGLFWLLTMAAYIHYARRPRLSRYLLVLAIFGLCIMTKPVVVTLPFALLLLDYWPFERVQWGQKGKTAAKTTSNQKPVGWLMAEKIPLLILSAILSVITLTAQTSGGAVPTLERLPLEYRVANMFLSYIKYIIKMIWPSGLAICYPHPLAILSDASVVISIILFMLLTAACIYAGRRRKYAAAGWLWYVGILLPVIGVVQSGAQGIANRYMYIPMLGLLMIIGWAAKDFTAGRPRAKTAAAVMGVLVLLSLLILTRMQVRYWENSLTLFRHDIEVTKDNALAENGYGYALSKLGILDEAEKHFQNALRISPAYSEARNNLANVYLKKGMFNEAIACFNEIIKRNDATADMYYNFAAALEMQKKYDEAIKYYAKSLEMNPKDPAANKRMGIALLAAGKTSEALGYAKRACELTEDKDAECLDVLSSAFAAAGKFDEAMKYLKKATELAPDNPDIHNKMGMALLSSGRPDEAITHFKYVLQKGTTPAETYANLGSAYIHMGKYDLAIENLSKAIELKPNNINALNNLSWILAAVNDVSLRNANRAIECARNACELTGYDDAEILDTLGIAYAAANRFVEAKATAEKALKLARETGQNDLASAIENRIKLYEAGQPYREK